MKLIDKDALVAEIKRLKKKNDTYNKPSHVTDVCYKEILSAIDTLEVKEVDIEQLNKLFNWWKEVTTEHSVYKVKEVDLEKEFESYMDKYNGVWVDSDYIKFAKHFFELGMQQSNNNNNNEEKS